MLRKIFIHARKSIKFIVLLLIAIFLIVGIVAYFYKPTYRVIIDGEQVGYTENKATLQSKINEYIQNGDGENVAFVQVEDLPEYELCLLKKGIVTNDEEIYEKVKTLGTTYYRYYAISKSQEEKAYVANFTEAEDIINKLKEKNSANMETIAISEKYETEIKDFINTEEAVSTLYEEPPKQETVTVAKTNKNSITNKSSDIQPVATSKLGISLIKPVSGIITSRFGVSSRIRVSNHTGLDIAASTGTPVKATSSGTVTWAGWKGSYGYLVIISHGNGIQTYYGHCSKLYVKSGQKVSQGETIAAVGSTGNSTGPHLHLEIRVNGVAKDPQKYLY